MKVEEYLKHFKVTMFMVDNIALRINCAISPAGGDQGLKAMVDNELRFSRFLILLLMIFLVESLYSQQIIPLYPGEIPNSLPHHMKEDTIFVNGKFKGFRKVSDPTLSIFLPDQKIATGYGVVICPGGGYIAETFKGEGTDIAEAFNRHGIAAFVLKYRLPSDSIMADKTIGPLQDAQKAIWLVRSRAAEWNIDPGKIGIMGFSAGGHLASTAGTHFKSAYIPVDDEVSLRPDFMILCYPVISMTDSLTHKGSRYNLLGENPSASQIVSFSSELQVDSDTPPAWLLHTGDDTAVSVENTIRFYLALNRNKVPSEMHIYPRGNHAFILRMDPEDWMKPLFEWILQLEL